MSNHTEQVIDEIKAERVRQQSSEGWTVEHDDEHGNGAMASAASAYACCAATQAWNPIYDPTLVPCLGWPWGRAAWNPKDPRRNLVRAGALIVAEIERLDRKALAAQAKEASRDS